MRPESHSPHRFCSGVFETSNQVSSDRPKFHASQTKEGVAAELRTVPRSPSPLPWHSVCNEHDCLFLTQHEGLTRHRSRMDIGWAPEGRDPDIVSNARLLRLTKGHTNFVPGFISTTRRRKEFQRRRGGARKMVGCASRCGKLGCSFRTPIGPPSTAPPAPPASL